MADDVSRGVTDREVDRIAARPSSCAAADDPMGSRIYEEDIGSQTHTLQAPRRPAFAIWPSHGLCIESRVLPRWAVPVAVRPGVVCARRQLDFYIRGSLRY